MTTKQTTTAPLLITPVEPVLILRVCDAEMRAYGGFQWPTSGPCVAPDWIEDAEWGNGLHGWLWGEGDHSAANIESTSNWLVVRVACYIDLKGKVKYPQGEVVYCGNKLDATTYIANNGGHGRAIIGGTATAGDGGTATAGDRGTATAGNGGTATAGDGGTATAGDRGTATAGNGGTATAGNGGTATASNWGTATAGDGGTATAGNWGTATASNWGTATAGNGGTATASNWGTATAGDRGTATAGNGGTATAGNGGAILIKRWNGKRFRFTLGNIGEDKDAIGEVLLANTAYKLDGNDAFIKY